MDTPTADSRPWYAGVTGYQWLVLIIASAGWVFDTFEGQIFNITRDQMLEDVLGTAASPESIKRWKDLLLAPFLVGGALGGVVFGMLGDRIGRKPTMALTILFYSVFSGLTYFATELWQIGTLRFLVALGVGGEWAVAAAIVAEVFPARARAHASGIFHATSVIGTWLATLAGLVVGSQWRWAYLVGVAPALLVLWVRSGIDEPDAWRHAQQSDRQRGSLRELFGDPRWRRLAILGVLLATTGLGTFWGVVIAGQDLTQELLVGNRMDKEQAAAKAKFAYGIVQAAGGGLGLLCFGPLAQSLGRKRAFVIMHLGALAIVAITCYVPRNYEQMLAVLPVYGFFTLGIHAGYAVYFPELFPSRLRATGAGVCFNGGRLLAAPVLVFSAQIKALPGLDLRSAVCLLSSLFAAGLVVLYFLPETKGRPLPE